MAVYLPTKDAMDGDKNRARQSKWNAKIYSKNNVLCSTVINS